MTDQNRQFLTTLANLGIATHRLDRIRDAARLHRQQLIGTSELYAVIEADDVAPAADQTDDHQVHCPLCPDARILDTPADAREHFTTAHPEQQMVGPGPWPLLANREEVAAAPAVDRAALRDLIADAIRDAACTGDCHDTEEECAQKRIQACVWERGVLTEVLGTPEVFADAVLGVLPEPDDRAALARVRAVLETEAVVGRSALEYRGLIASALMADEAQPATKPDRCPHGCDTSACPCLACEDDGPEPEPDPDCERCDGSGLDPDAYFVNGDVWTHAPCSECLPEDDEPAAGARQDGAQP